jgi:hypothetical protein
MSSGTGPGLGLARGLRGLSAEPSDQTVLGIDLDAKRLWMERQGRTLDRDDCDLPKDLAWALYRTDVNRVEPLHGVVRLAVDSGRGLRPTSSFYLVGEGPGWYLGVDLGRAMRGVGGTQVGLAFRPEHLATAGRQTGAAIPLRLIAEPSSQVGSALLPAPAEAQAESQTRRAADSNDAAARWLAIQRALYVQLERQVAGAGMTLTELSVSEGLDHVTGCAMLSAHEELTWLAKWLRRYFGTSGSASVSRQKVAIDQVGPGLWYVRSLPRPPASRGGDLKMEFLLSSGDQVIPSKACREALQTGRRYYAGVNPGMPAEHVLRLANGVHVEILGVCECPTPRKGWWGPDGRPLKDAPWVYWNVRESMPATAPPMLRMRVGAMATRWRQGREARDYVVVVRVTRAVGSASIGMVQWERSDGIQGGGLQMDGDLWALIPHCDPQVEWATAVLAVPRGTGPLIGTSGWDWVRLEKISLRPGADCGFKLVHPAEPLEPMESPQAPPRMGTFEVRRVPNEAIVRRLADPSTVQTSRQR